ncbi:translation initiation factor eIF-2B subunit alpha [Ascosphaera acerosa]|nr:translation initiation factor eIF-2B subunit alpha [Ascosphaera acerosa]
MGQVDTVVVGAEGVVLNGGIISRMGTYQMGIMAQALKTPFYVVAESHKFVRLYPLGQYDLPFDQDIIQFKTSNDVTRETERRAATAAAAAAADGTGRQGKGHTAQSTSSQPSTTPSSEKHEWAVDYTPPNLITAIITESGVLTPSAVSEELIKIWF